MVSLTTTARCDVCFHEVSTGHTSEAAMLAELCALGWQVGADGLLCPDCAADAVCAAVGCTFTPWRPCRCHGQLPGHAAERPAPANSAECGVQFRWCERCSVHQERHPLDARSAGPALGEVPA